MLGEPRGGYKIDADLLTLTYIAKAAGTLTVGFWGLSELYDLEEESARSLTRSLADQ